MFLNLASSTFGKSVCFFSVHQFPSITISLCFRRPVLSSNIIVQQFTFYSSIQVITRKKRKFNILFNKSCSVFQLPMLRDLYRHFTVFFFLCPHFVKLIFLFSITIILILPNKCTCKYFII